jgi:histidinol dehydrogenase
LPCTQTATPNSTLPSSHHNSTLAVSPPLLCEALTHDDSCGDYASGTNHTLPTNGFARQFSGVNTLSFQKHITSQELTREGLKVLGPTVVTLAEREGLEAHANAVRVRLREMGV